MMEHSELLEIFAQLFVAFAGFAGIVAAFSKIRFSGEVKTMRNALNGTIIGLVISGFAMGATPDTVLLEDLTWVEVREAIDQGATTVIVPTAGLEQTGPHIVLGKHKYVVMYGADRIARELGNALVAPVMMYVPEGEIDPPEGHMRYAGTISIPPDVFKSVLEYTARSLKVHGFTDILFIGDSGPNQRPMQEVADDLNREWTDDDTRVHYVSEWYTTTSSKFMQWLLDQGETEKTLGNHGGIADTAVLMYAAPEQVRNDEIRLGQGNDVDGVVGDPRRASRAYGEVGFNMRLEAALAQIGEMLGRD
jgi:creatinine amidohydrolase/Fe(II)-dependent formamide hydrolase-like protein